MPMDRKALLAPSVLVPLTRPRYFHGRMLTADDFNREQQYHLGARRRLNLATVGPGVVAGLKVTPSGKGRLSISPGLAIDGLGREIVVPTPAELAIPANLGSAVVVVSYVEEPIEPTPSTGAPDGVEFGAVRETFRAWISPTPPSDGVVLGKVPTRPPVKTKPGRRPK